MFSNARILFTKQSFPIVDIGLHTLEVTSLISSSELVSAPQRHLWTDVSQHLAIFCSIEFRINWRWFLLMPRLAKPLCDLPMWREDALNATDRWTAAMNTRGHSVREMPARMTKGRRKSQAIVHFVSDGERTLCKCHLQVPTGRGMKGTEGFNILSVWEIHLSKSPGKLLTFSLFFFK